MEKRKKLIIGSSIVVLLLAVAIGLIVYYVTRPDNIPITKAAEDAESEPTVVMFSEIEGFPGEVLVEETFLLSNTSDVRYYLTITTDMSEYPTQERLDLYFTDLTNYSNITSLELLLMMANTSYGVFDVQDLIYPYRLMTDSFNPNDYKGFAFVESNQIVAASEFESAPSLSSTNLPVLSAELEGRSSYRVTGRITIDYTNVVQNGEVVQRPVLIFENVETPSAPGPFLYLSREPHRLGRGLEDNDIYIPIDDTASGSYTQDGTFEQPLDEIMDVNMLSEFTNGAFVVWCRPARVFLGGGQLRLQN